MNLQESFDTNKPPQVKRIKADLNKRTLPLHTGVLLRFSLILFFLFVFLCQVFYALSITRAVKADVAMQNELKASYYQSAIDDPNQVSSLSAKVNQVDATILQLEDDLDVTVNMVTLGCVVSIFFTALLTYTTLQYIKKNVVEPLYQFHEQAEKMEEGDLNLDFCNNSSATEVYGLGIAMQNSILEVQRVIRILNMGLQTLSDKNFQSLPPADFRGDFAPIEASFHKLIHVVSATMQNIVRSADEVNQGANHVSNGAQNLAHGATHQANSVEKLSETIESVTKLVTDTADSAKEANKLGEHAEEVLISSSKEMGELMAAIDQIEHSSSDIEQIIKTIDDIAFQTNILALNAAIEAARAGQFGKSFAVVADEVRSLAQKSADAAHNTNGLIESSLQAIRRGASLAKSTDAAFGEAKESSSKILEVVRHIAEASQEQAKSIEDIQQNVEEISAVISNNSATSEESAAASEELSGQASLMHDMLYEFKLD